jgi:ATP-dependent Lon protease
MESGPNPAENDTYEAPAMLAEGVVLLPEMEVTLSVRDARNIAAASQALLEHKLVVVVPSSDLEGAVGSIGTLVHIREVHPVSGLGVQSDSKGLWRVKVDKVLGERPYPRVRFSRAGEAEDPSARPRVMDEVLGQIDEFVSVIPGIPPEIISFLKSIRSPGKLADMCGYSPFLSNDDRLDLLRTLDPEERLRKVQGLFARQLGELKKATRRRTILECSTCADLADKAFELGPEGSDAVAQEFLEHVSREHPDEVLGLLAEKYGPAFLRRRSLK